MAEDAESREALEVTAVDPASRKARDLAERVAGSDLSVLLRGESGVGKSFWALWMHGASLRRTAPFVVIDCASIPEGLLESDLMGYTKGAFTDALSSKPGRLELAHGGTVVLDHLAEMPPTLQAKLLRVLEEKAVMRVGDTKERKIDIRCMGCAPVHIEALVKAGRFREDLYFRLNTVSVEIPALRERQRDIVPLVRLFLKKFSAQYRKPAARFDEAVLRSFLLYAWPGNVRELEHAMERAVVLSESDTLTLDHFPMLVHQGEEAALEQAASGGLSLREVEDLYLERVLARSGGNVSRAARTLGISRKTFYAKRRRALRGGAG